MDDIVRVHTLSMSSFNTIYGYNISCTNLLSQKSCGGDPKQHDTTYLWKRLICPNHNQFGTACCFDSLHQL